MATRTAPNPRRLEHAPARRSAGITSGDQLAAATRIQDTLPDLELTTGQALAVLTVALEALGAIDGGERR